MKKFSNVTSVILNLLHKMVLRYTRQRSIYIDANTATQYFLMLMICQTIFYNAMQRQAIIHLLGALAQVEDPSLPDSLQDSPQDSPLCGNVTRAEIGTGESPR